MPNTDEDVVLRIDDDAVCTLADLVQANDFDEDELEALRALDVGERYTGGGGAFAAWTVERIVVL
jgi:hypothetical protein